MFSLSIIRKRQLLGGLFAALLAAPVMAQNYVVEVHGIVCQFCSYGVAKKVSKLDFIDQDAYKKGVKVEIEKQAVYFAVKAGQNLDEAALYQAIESGGYQPIKTWRLNAAGEREELK